MCGGCGAREDVDWLSPVVATRFARAGAATTATALCRDAGLRLAVGTGPGGWTLRSPTGRTAIAATLTRLWELVGAWHGGVPDVDPPPRTADAGAPLAPCVLAAPARQVAILVGRAGEGAASRAQGWTIRDAVDAVDAVGGDVGRLLLLCPDAAGARRALGVVTAAGALRRRVVSALLRDGEGPAWLDDVSRCTEPALSAVLGGSVGGSVSGRREVVRGASHDLPALACWAASRVASGALAGARLRVVAGEGEGAVVLDAADGIGVSARLVG